MSSPKPAPRASPSSRRATTGRWNRSKTGCRVSSCPIEDPEAVAATILRLIDDPAERRRLGGALRAKVERDYAVAAVVPQWQAMFDAVLAERRPAPPPTLFRSFFQGGIESSTHRRQDGRRLDMIAAIGHDRHAAADYRTLAGHSIRTVRDGLRWHLIETTPGRYDWSSFLPMLRAARETGTQVLWDLLHYGWPDDLDIWRPAFVDRFARFAAAAARVVRDETDEVPFYCSGERGFVLRLGRGGRGLSQPLRAGARPRAEGAAGPHRHYGHGCDLGRRAARPLRPCRPRHQRDHASGTAARTSARRGAPAGAVPGLGHDRGPRLAAARRHPEAPRYRGGELLLQQPVDPRRGADRRGASAAQTLPLSAGRHLRALWPAHLRGRDRHRGRAPSVVAGPHRGRGSGRADCRRSG